MDDAGPIAINRINTPAIADVPSIGWWRIVCHSCGYRFEPMAFVPNNPGSSGSCCRTPNHHKHTSALCTQCYGPTGPLTDAPLKWKAYLALCDTKGNVVARATEPAFMPGPFFIGTDENRPCAEVTRYALALTPDGPLEGWLDFDSGVIRLGPHDSFALTFEDQKGKRQENCDHVNWMLRKWAQRWYDAGLDPMEHQR